MSKGIKPVKTDRVEPEKNLKCASYIDDQLLDLKDQFSRLQQISCSEDTLLSFCTIFERKIVVINEKLKTETFTNIKIYKDYAQKTFEKLMIWRAQPSWTQDNSSDSKFPSLRQKNIQDLQAELFHILADFMTLFSH